MEPAALCRQLRGDLDWIVVKAIEKDRTRRYATAKDMADDLQRHLRCEPVVAGPPGVGYRIGKFIRRHRIGVLAGGCVVLALFLGLSLATAGLVQANRARDQLKEQRNAALEARTSADQQRQLADRSAAAALQEATRAATVNQFLQNMLRSVDPAKAQGRQVTVRYVLDQAVERLDEGALQGQADVEGDIRLTLGETYSVLGLYDAAEAQLRQADAMQRSRLGEDAPETLRCTRLLAGVLRVKGQPEEAEPLLRQTLTAQRRALGPEHAETLNTLNELALALRDLDRLSEAESLHRQVLELRRRALGAEHTDTLASMSHLGEVCRALGKPQEAEVLLRQALDGLLRVLGEEHPQTTAAMNNLGRFFEDQNDLQQAEQLYSRTYELEVRILGPDHPRTLLPMDNLLRVLKQQGKVAEARPLIGERLARLRRAAERPDAKPLTLHACAWELLNCEATELRDPQAALAVAARTVERDGTRDPRFLETLASAQYRAGELDQAIATQRQALAAARSGGPYNRAEMEATLGAYLVQKGDFMGAASAVSLDQTVGRLGGSLFTFKSPDAALAAQAQKLMDEGRFDEAATLLHGCLAMRQKELPEGHWQTEETRSLLGAALAGTGEFEQAEALLLDAYESMKDNRQAPADRKRQALGRIVQLYSSWNKPQQQAQWLRQVTQPPEPAQSAPPLPPPPGSPR
jgi:hypothetical protein